MATSTLVNHKGAKEVTWEQLHRIEAPLPTATWYPVPHYQVLSHVRDSLTMAGYNVARQRLSVSHEGHRFFGTLDLESRILDGITLAVGIRNSTDKTFPIGFCCGNRVFVCDNLAFTSEIVISKKHTKYGQDRYIEGLSTAVASLTQFRVSQERFIGRLQAADLSLAMADSIMLRSYEQKIVTSRLLPKVIDEWRNPSFDDFTDHSAWSLWNCFTTVLGRTVQGTHPAKAAATTIRLQGLFSDEPRDLARASAEEPVERWV